MDLDSLKNSQRIAKRVSHLIYVRMVPVVAILLSEQELTLPRKHRRR